MRRLARHLFTLCSAASAGVLVAVLAVWVRSGFRSDHVTYQPSVDQSVHRWEVWWVRGRLGVGTFAAESLAMSQLIWSSDVSRWASVPGPGEREFLGVRFLSGTEWVFRPPATGAGTGPLSVTEVRELAVSLPCWQVAALSACLPAAWVVRRRRREVRRLRSERGWCVRCGYDLCATPGRCPECGTTFR